MQLKFNIPFWQRAPFVRLLVPLVAGLCIQYHFPLPVNILLVVGAGTGCALVLFSFVFKKQYTLQPVLLGGTIMLALFVLGCWLVWRNDVRNRPLNITRRFTPGMAIRAVMPEPFIPGEKTNRAVLRVIAVIDSGREKPASGKILAFFKNDSAPPQTGSELVFLRAPEQLREPANPGTTDYRRYYLFRGITHQVYLTKNDYGVRGREPPGNVGRFLDNIKNYTLKTLHRYIPGEQEGAVAAALLIGYRGDMDRELTQAYSNTGTIHVIAISGMHLGLIYTLVLGLFRPLKGKKITRWLKPLVAIGVLWLFALVAGAAPSILRSAVMFSCLAIGESLGRRTNIYNTLAASAFLLLCSDPFALWDVGFQLSYAAVLSIVVIHPPLYRRWQPENKWLNAVWNLTAVTLAAQILTLPLVIVHFHQFPNFFLFSNLLAVPLSSLILLLEIVLMAVSFIGPAAHLLGQITGWLIAFLNGSMEWMGRLPYAVTGGLQISGWECLCLFLLIIFGARWLLQYQRGAIYYALFSLLAWGSFHIHKKIVQQQQVKLVVYQVPGAHAIDFIQAREYAFAGDSSVLRDRKLFSRQLEPGRRLWNVHAGRLAGLHTVPPFYFFRGNRILVVDSNFRFQSSGSEPAPVDIVILAHNPKLYMRKLVEMFTVKQVVADGSNPAWKIRLWKRDCASLGIPFHETAKEGAFVKVF